jgi:hypothetical protein
MACPRAIANPKTDYQALSYLPIGHQAWPNSALKKISKPRFY